MITIWTEDDAGLHDPDRDGVERAYARIFGRSFERSAARVLDYGDATDYCMPGGEVVTLSYPGNSAIAVPDDADLPILRRCAVLACQNRQFEGQFVGEVCAPCWGFLTTGRGRHSQAYRNALETARQTLDDIATGKGWHV